MSVSGQLLIMSTLQKPTRFCDGFDCYPQLLQYLKFMRGWVLLFAIAGQLFAVPALAQSFVSPTRIAQMPSGDVVVADSKRQVLVLVSSNPKKADILISVPGRPVSVAFGWGKFFVGNEVTQSVDVLSRNGRLQYILGGESFHIARPSDIAIDKKLGLIFVSDSATAKVWVFDKGGELLRSLPAAGQIPLYRPTGIAVDPTRGEVLVSDFGDPQDPTATVNVYDYDGFYKASVNGSAGCGWFACVGDFNFSRPQGLAVDSMGLIYLVDSVLGQVLVFDRETQKGVNTIGQIGKGPGQLMLPLDLIMHSKTGDLHVTNNRNRRLEVFDNQGLAP